MNFDVLLCAVVAGATLLLGCCTVVDTIDRLRDRSPYAAISGFLTIVFGVVCGFAVSGLLDALHAT